MDPIKQQIAIAEACGIKFICRCNHSTSAEGLYGVAPDGKETRVPDYLNDLNAMHKAEEILVTAATREDNWRTYDAYRLNIEAVTGSEDAFRATAAQRAEAFLRTLNLWTED